MKAWGRNHPKVQPSNDTLVPSEELTESKSAAFITSPALPTSLPTMTLQIHHQTQIQTLSPTTAPQDLLEELAVRAADGHISTMVVVKTTTIMARPLVPRKSTNVNGGSQARMLTRRCRSRRSELQLRFRWQTHLVMPGAGLYDLETILIAWSYGCSRDTL